MNVLVRRATGGRPTAEAAAALEAMILDHATAAFLADGYAATTIGGIATACGVAKRTIYARWDGKPALFRASLERLLKGWLATTGDWTGHAPIEASLLAAARQILAVALTPEAVALHRLLVAESGRFPELALLIRQAGADEGQWRVIRLLDRAVANGELPPQDTALAAEQFMYLVLAGPQRRALGLQEQLDAAAVDTWAIDAVRLFLRGAAS